MSAPSTTAPPLDVRLLPLAREHLPAVQALMADREVAQFTLFPVDAGQEFVEQWFAGYERGRAERTKQGFAAVDGSGTFLGLALAVHIDEERAEVELGYAVAPASRGRGVAASILEQLTRWSFNQVGAQRVQLTIDAANIASRAVASRAGYHREGVMRSSYFKDGQRSDAEIWSRLPRDPDPADRRNALALRQPANLVSPRAVLFWTVRALLGWLIFIGLQVVILAFTHTAGHQGVNITILIVSALLAVAHLAIMPRWRYRVHRWELTGTAFYSRSGWVTQERRIAPVSRIQTVDTERGPLEQVFGLANVTVTTASAAGPIKLRGVSAATADQLVADLTSITARSEGDAT
ncbi:MAG: transrane protein distant y with ydbS [Frankiales bacterium]|nr:transrane protein distant y with ydbS [Frankiales bacterium]